MSVLVAPRRRIAQPQGVVGVDWANPFADGLAVAFLPVGGVAGRNLLDGSAGIEHYGNYSSCFIATTPAGLGFGFTGYYGDVGIITNVPGINSATATSVVYVKSYPASTMTIFTGDTLGDGFQLRVNTDGTVALRILDYFAGSVYKTFTTTATLPLGRASTIVATATQTGDNSVAIYINGALAYSQSSAIQSFQYGAQILSRVGYKAYAEPAYDASATMYVLGVFAHPKKLASPVCMAMSANPWQLFAPDTDTIFFGAASVQSVQTAYPRADAASGLWLPSAAGSPTELFAMVDESVASDTDYIYTGDATTCALALQSLSDPSSSTGHVVHYRCRVYTGTLTARLKQGVTTIASWSHTTADAGAMTTFSQTLSSGEANSITDYSALKLEFETS